jgi:hypothetical protein
MSRAKLLRQYLQDYNRKLNKADDIYREQYGAYKAQAEEYNAFVESVKAGQQQGIGEYAPGAYTVLKGYTDSSGQPGFTAAYADKKGNPQMAGPVVDKLPDAPGGLNGVYLKNPDGTATFHTWGGGTDFLGNPLVDENGNPVASGWQRSSITARVMDPSYIQAPTQKAPRAPTFTQNQLQEMQNPTDDPAAIVKANALGYTGNPRLKADEPASRNSAFTNLIGNDPNSLREKGVLARTLAGDI